MEKKNTGLIITIVVLVVLLLGLFGYVCYDKFYLDKRDDVSKVNNKINENVNFTGTFDVFAKTLKANRVKHMQEDSKNNISTNADVYNSANGDIGYYSVLLTDDGKLSVSYDKDSLKKYDTTIDSNVLFYELVNFGNGGYKTLLYVKEDGRLYNASVEYDVYSENKKAVGSLYGDYKDIVLIRQVGRLDKSNGVTTGFKDLELVDINGNTYYPFRSN